MRGFCPVCMKSGIQMNITLVQINFEEAVWMCRSETCHWPFGYTDFELVEVHSNDSSVNGIESSNIKIDQNTQSMLSVLSLYTPPLTPASENVNKEVFISTTSVTGNLESTSVNIDSENVSSTEMTRDGSFVEQINFETNFETKFETKNESFASNYEVPQLSSGSNSLKELKNSANISNFDSSKCSETRNSITIDKDESNTKVKKIINEKCLPISPYKTNVTTLTLSGLPPVVISYPAPDSILMPKIEDKESCISLSSDSDSNIETIEKIPVVPRGIKKAMRYRKFSFSKLRENLKTEENSETKLEDKAVNSGRLDVKIVSDNAKEITDKISADERHTAISVRSERSLDSVCSTVENVDSSNPLVDIISDCDFSGFLMPDNENDSQSADDDFLRFFE